MGKKKKKKSPEPLEISLEETEALLKRIDEKKLEDKDFEKIKAFIKSFVFIQRLLERQKLSIKKLKNLFFGKTEKSKNILPETESNKDKAEGEGKGEGEGEGEGEGSGSGIEDPKKKKVEKKKKGHGKNGASAYVGAEVVYVSHKKLKAGQLCPDCKNAKIYKWYKDGIEIRVKGSAPLKATVYRLEKLRCALCGKIYTAELPEEAGEDKYDAEARSIISLLKYGSGFPYNRLENFQKALGVPVPASTQWDNVYPVFETAVHPYEVLVRQAAQGDLFHIDDTGVKILSIIKENKEKKAVEEGAADWEKRKANYTSGIISKVGDHVIVLYFSGRKYAGENLDEVLRKRAMDLGPLMDKLEKWFEEQFTQKKIEENSNLGQVINYMQNHWQKLTGFLRIEGAPLDNNCLEQALKVAILNRKNAYFYKTENGAHVGDVLMSLIETCRRAKANPFEYLTKLQENAIDVINNPGKWLPWNYKETIAEMGNEPGLNSFNS